MPLSNSQLLDIAARAATLGERMDAAQPADSAFSAGEQRAEVEARLQNWRDAAARGDLQKWRERLSLDGWDERVARRAAAPDFRAANASLPLWARLLGEILGASARGNAVWIPGSIPFATVLARWVAWAVRGVDFAPDWSGSVRRDLQNSLFSRLATLAAPSLDLEWSIARNLAKTPADPTSKRGFEAWSAEISAGGWEKIALEYPVLARQMTGLCVQWREIVAEFGARFEADRGALETAFGIARGASIARLATQQSDPHAGGRGVWILEFGSGQKLVYKAKECGAEVAFFRFLNELNTRQPPCEFRAPQSVERAGYAWFEFISRAPVTEPRAFYRRGGALLCVLHLLDATDFHGENLIACGDFPVPIDAEALFSPRAQMENAAAGAGEAAARRLDESVLRTGMLPHFEAGPDVRGSYDISGLGGSGKDGPRGATRRFSRWEHCGSDAQSRAESWEAVPRLPAAPFGADDAEELEPAEWAGEIEAGFAQTHAWLRQERASLSRADGPISQLEKHPVRWIFRATGVYGALLEQARRPHWLRDGWEHSVKLELLSRAFFAQNGAVSSALWPLQRAETAALEQLDIPLFRADPTSADVPLGNASLSGVFEASPATLVRQRFEKWDENHAQEQAESIREVFRARRAGKANVAAIAVPVAVADCGANSLEIAPDFAACSAYIAAEITRRAVRFGDQAAWHATGFSPRTLRYQLQPIGSGLYSGSAGIALFLGAFGRLEGDENALELGRAALRGALATQGERGLGLADSASGLAFALCHFAALTGESAWFESARSVLARLGPELIEKDARLDVLGGAAGALLGLLSLPRRFRDHNWQRAARACGAHLQNKRVEVEGCDERGEGCAGAAWPTLDERHLCGFSHGAAGIALALERGARELGEISWRQTALEAANWERAQFDVEAQNWPDLRYDERAFTVSWCHGAPGIALARRAATLEQNAAWQSDIERALESTSRAETCAIDHLCCGNTGRAVALWQDEENAAHRAAAMRLAAPIAARRDGFALLPGVEAGAFCPGFFDGSAGIGYALLWMQNPQLPPLWSFPAVEDST